MDDFYAARSRVIPPLPWPTFAPAFSVSLATAIWLQTMVPLTAGDTVELQGYFRVADGYFAADHTSFWGCKVG